MTGTVDGRLQAAGLDSALAEEMVYGRPTELRVFISSEMGRMTLAEQREAAVEAVEGGRLGPDFWAWHWERDADAGPYSSLDVCLRMARSSDFLVLIVGSEITPTTLAEYEHARDAGVHCCIFTLQGVDRDAQVQAFIDRERERAVTKSFRSSAELATGIVVAIQQARNQALRRQAVERRALVADGRSGRPNPPANNTRGGHR